MGTRMAVSTKMTAWGRGKSNFHRTGFPAGVGLTQALGRRAGFPCTAMGARAGSSFVLVGPTESWDAPYPGASL